MNVRRIYSVTGAVQGVGFRPALYRLARAARLGGCVRNQSGDVSIVLEGRPDAIETFVTGLTASLPDTARIDTLACVSEMPLPATSPATEFTIVPSTPGGGSGVLIPPDLAMCADCRSEITTRGDRRHAYAFTTCTRCGPRYTVVNAMPYDRERTTLSCFPLCARCAAEYADPADRRFHAESTACPECGPALAFHDAAARLTAGNPLPQARALLARGGILAVRGLGGFLLAVDASNRESITELRRRKHRPAKPFAVMAADAETFERFWPNATAAQRLMDAPESPIVILDAPTVGAIPIAMSELSPDTDTLGVMLPTTPLHHLLAHGTPGDPVPTFPFLVMTSGNHGGEPICITNGQAFERLAGIADGFLVHNREINLRCDDSLAAIRNGAPQVWRRARGFAPAPISVPVSAQSCVLAMGAELKNAIAIAYGNQVVCSPHIGDLATPEAIDGQIQVAGALPAFLGRTIETVAIDLHPDMHASRLGTRIARDGELALLPIQHHHAHAVACLAEHGHTSGLALCFDGTGLGTDDSIWGAELLHIDGPDYKRLATFDGVPLPGGDAAVQQPIRQLVAHWQHAGIPPADDWLVLHAVQQAHLVAWQRQCTRHINSPTTHAAGRLFDTFAVLTGICPADVSYEGQGPIRLEALARRHHGPPPAIPMGRQSSEGDFMTINWGATIAHLTAQGLSRDAGARAATAYACHVAVAAAAAAMIHHGIAVTGAQRVALSGGVFMNQLLTRLLQETLNDTPIDVLIHRRIPPNDGGIAFGQAVIAGYHVA